ncbi:lytic transglycosylase domain-containing protein [Bradyrhizobium sp.]|uniref:lytic transglycosylase domain-containing protein n=1 Tax=Bradyrhizobium sp. TaxID=376 RepID=UPI0023874CAB|nr:lytic transglycosylase domain-containing protein [Bradyrhizobium sp.]MDE2380100.1 lytic transglycosylase domain-containing protein [Bradyrhizobium sp.]
MKSSTIAAAIVAVAVALPQIANAGEADYAGLIAAHARVNGVPESLVHRVIMRESRYHSELVGRGGTIGLMQIKLATARGVGYTGDAAGLRDPATNLAYGVKYLAGAYRAANGDHARAMHYYAGGYYHVAKRQRLEIARQDSALAQGWLEPSGNPQPPPGATPRKKLAKSVWNARAQALR